MKLSILAVTFTIAVLSTITTPAESATLRMHHGLGDGGKETLDPYHTARFREPMVMLMNRLVRPDQKGIMEPDLAISWSADKTATTWTFKLREGVKFHDGTDFDADDVIYSLGRIKNPELDSPVASVLGIVESVEAVDPLTVKIKLSGPHSDLPLLLSDYRVRMMAKDSADTIAKTGLGTGPYMLVSVDPEGTTYLKANPNYWEGAPKVENFEIIAIPDGSARVQALLTGQIDALSGVSIHDAKLFDSEKFNIHAVSGGNWVGIAFRTDVKPYTDPRIRKALRIATDRQAMLKLVVGQEGGVITCDHPVWSGDQYRTDFDCPQQIDESKRLLAEAGYPDGIEIDIFTTDRHPAWINMVQVYQQQAAPAGIKVNLVKAPSDGYWDDVWMKKPACTTNWSQRPADQILNEDFRGGASWNETYYNKPEFDALLDKAREELDFNKRKALYAQLQKILYEDGGLLIPFHLNEITISSSKVSGFNMLDDIYRYHLMEKSE